jgi:short-subunit dehydrogenase
MKELRGRTVVLTGASRGIGPYIGRALAREGVQLALAARSAEQLEAVAKEIAGLGVRAVAIPTDVTDDAGRKALLERAEAELGPVDILVNNAGIEEVVSFARQAPEDTVKIIETNLIASLLLARYLLPGMLERRRGHIVSMASLAGKKGMGYISVYTATKAGLIEWTAAIRAELAGTGVSASVICPGFVAEAGMYASYGKQAPRLTGAVAPERVAQAVVRAIRNDLPEVLVSPMPIRPLLALNTLAPGLGNAVVGRMGITNFFREVAEDRGKV